MWEMEALPDPTLKLGTAANIFILLFKILG